MGRKWVLTGKSDVVSRFVLTVSAALISPQANGTNTVCQFFFSGMAKRGDVFASVSPASDLAINMFSR